MSAHFIRLNLLLGTEIVQMLSDIQAAMLVKRSLLDRPMCAARISICSTTAAIHLLRVTLRLLVVMWEALLVPLPSSNNNVPGAQLPVPNRSDLLLIWPPTYLTLTSHGFIASWFGFWTFKPYAFSRQPLFLPY